ncbi:MAG: bifunctional folylpolyglutamate synthase/dihydrofolate synthase [Lachnospiraceae bacterium]|nr:bifunctional folylpolyglutamate synthase/dihydrofolate synthase [Lachnospiraceae bacterium]
MKDKNVKEFEKNLDSLGWVFGLEAVSSLVDEMGIGDNIPVIHVAGTNGKGSVCMMLSNIFKEAGLKAGLYISPAVFDSLETISIDGQNITEESYDKHMLSIREACERVVKKGLSHPTAFEVKTALAYGWFYENKCDVIVFETGLGGLTDATNFIKNPLCSVITEIGMDHMDILGESIEDIARAKAGIIKEGCPVFTGVSNEQALNVIKEVAGEKHSKLTLVDFPKKEYRLTSPVPAQQKNAALAFSVAEFVLEKLNLSVADAVIEKGISLTTFPGRFEKICDEPTVYIDGGHNVQAVTELKKTIELLNKSENHPGRKWVFVFGILKDKDYESVIDIMAPLAKTFHVITVPNSRALEADVLKNEIEKRGVKAFSYEDIGDAYKAACLEAKEEGTKVLAFGSFYYLKRII